MYSDENCDLAYIIATKRKGDQTPSLAKTLWVLYATFDAASAEFQKITADMQQYYAIHAVFVRVGVAVDREVDNPRVGQPTAIAQLLLDLCDRPRDEWNAAVGAMKTSELQELESAANKMVQDCAQLSAYLSSRGAAGMGDGGHEDALNRSKARLKHVRRALGYTHP